MAIHKLSAARIAKLTKNGMYGDGGNLWLSVTNDGAGKSWVFRWTQPGTRKDRNIGFGPLHTVDLDQARELAKANRLLLLEGKDPKAYRDDQRLDAAIALGRAKTVEQVADEYWDAKIARKSLSYRRATHIILRDFVRTPIGTMPIQKVDRGVVLEKTGLQEAWATKHVTAKMAHLHLRRIFELAIAKGYYRGENPASWDHLKHTLPSRGDVHQVKHYASLPLKDVGRFMEKLRAHRFRVELGGEVYQRAAESVRSVFEELSGLSARAAAEELNRRGIRTATGVKWRGMNVYRMRHRLGREFPNLKFPNLKIEDRPTVGFCAEFAILSGVREGEALLARWKEIDIPHMVWHVPPEHRKTGSRTRAVRSIPITKPMLAVLEEMQSRRKNQSDEAVIFPAARGAAIYGPNLGRYLRETIAWEPKATLHGFRSTLRDWCRANRFPNEYWEITVDHAIGDRTSQSYGHDQLIEQRRDMMEKWGEFCSRPAPEPQAGEVVVKLAERRR
jgi:integrase